MATAVFPALPGFLFKGPFSDALAFLQPVIYSGVCSLPRANGTQQRHNAPHTKLPSAFELKLEPNGKVFIFIPELRSRHHTANSTFLSHLIKFADVGFDPLLVFNRLTCSLLWFINVNLLVEFS